MIKIQPKDKEAKVREGKTIVVSQSAHTKLKTLRDQTDKTFAELIDEILEAVEVEDNGNSNASSPNEGGGA